MPRPIVFVSSLLTLSLFLFWHVLPAAPQEKPPAAVQEGNDLILEIQLVETVKQGRRETRTIHYTVEIAVRPESGVYVKSAIGTTGVVAEGSAGKFDQGALEIRLKGDMLTELAKDHLPPGVKPPAFNSRPFSIDGKVELGKRAAIGVVEDTNKVVNITTFLTLKRRGDSKDLLDTLKSQGGGTGK